MAVNIKLRYKLTGLVLTLGSLWLSFQFPSVHAKTLITEPVQACVLAHNAELTRAVRANIAQCLGWQSEITSSRCAGAYQPILITPLSNDEEVHVLADNVSFYNADHPSKLNGHVQVQQGQRVVNAQTAYIYRNTKTNAVDKIELLGNVQFLEPDHMMIAEKVTIDPQDKSGIVNNVIYRFNAHRADGVLPAWGRATFIQRFANKDYVLQKATYSNCAPQDRTWELRADSISLDDAKGVGVARNATLRIHDTPVLYTPYLSFPTNRERKSGFLMPVGGYTTHAGGDLAFPYYWNMAPNYDATLIPHWYSRRGLMVGGVLRYLTPSTSGSLESHILPADKAYRSFLLANVGINPLFANRSANRWNIGVNQSTNFSDRLHLNLNYQQVSDDYYFQDFSTNLAVATERQLLQKADLAYMTDHWLFRGLVQSYQTLHPINESLIENIYQLLPQLSARGNYADLPLGSNLQMLGQYDQFRWPKPDIDKPEGARLLLNPVASLPLVKPWGYLTSSAQLVEKYYDVQHTLNTSYNNTYNLSIPRFNIDSGLYFDRDTTFFGNALRQTLEPRAFYLYVPYRNQTTIPVYDSAYMIFNVDQLFRTNRFSGYDRISDANQLALGVTTRWLSQDTGAERASITVGQLYYFKDRRVQLCQSYTGYCIDNPLTLGYLSLNEDTSPIASRGVYRFNSHWALTGDYVWDPAIHATNNGQLNLHYQPEVNKIIQIGYTYLVNGDLTRVAGNLPEDNSLHQATIGFSWPLTEKWSTLGAYSYNVSKGYTMLTFAGLQYDSCCWAWRVLGGQTFNNLGPQNTAQYNNSVYLQILLKGLGSVASSNPSSTINTYIPGYRDQFHR